MAPTLSEIRWHRRTATFCWVVGAFNVGYVFFSAVPFFSMESLTFWLGVISLFWGLHMDEVASKQFPRKGVQRMKGGG